MKKLLVLFFAAVILVACGTNTHTRYTNGAVVTESRSMTGIYVQVDTTGDAVADVEAEVVGNAMWKNYTRGDSMSVDVRSYHHYAEAILK
jgi:uncharacterized protein YcfL